MISRVNWDALPWQLVVPGFERKVFNAGGATLALHRLWATKSPNPHSHLHEQISWQIEGEFEFHIGDEIIHLKPGDVATIPPHVTHTGYVRNGDHCLVLDIFVPRRDEYADSYTAFVRSLGRQESVD